MSLRHASFIAGEACAGARGYDLAAADGGSLGTWPRASGAELERAALAAQASAADWQRRPRAEREAHALALESELRSAPDPDGLFARRLGLGAREVEALAGASFGEARPAQGAGEGPAGACELARPHWSALWSELLAAARATLARGGALVVVSDARAPMLGDALAAAARRARLPDGLVQVVHDDRPAAWIALAALLGGARLRACAPADELERLQERLEGALGAELETPFGAGVSSRPGAHAPLLEALECGERRVRVDDDPRAAASEVARALFGRVPALCGQRPNAPRRVLVDERIFSRFSAAFLEALGALTEDPVPLLEPADRAWLARARELGLDEGATLLLDAVEGSSLRGGASTLFGLVFTNVEAKLRLARLTRPAPLACLVRVPAERPAPPTGAPGLAVRPDAGTPVAPDAG